MDDEEVFVFAIPEGYGEEGEEFIINIVDPEEAELLLSASDEEE